MASPSQWARVSGTPASADAGSQVVVGQIVLAAGVDHLASTLACQAAGNGAYCRAGCHPDRAGNRAQRCTCRSSATGTLGEVVVAQLIAAFRINYLRSAFARKTASDRTDRGPCGHADRTPDSPKASTGYRTSRGTRPAAMLFTANPPAVSGTADNM